MQKRKKFTKEFKLEALRLIKESDKPAAEAARELGIRRNQLYKWQQEVAVHEEEAFPGHGRRQAKDDEVARLKRELAHLKEERGILIKAALNGRHAYQISETQSGMLHIIPVIGHNTGRLRASPMQKRGPLGGGGLN